MTHKPAATARHRVDKAARNQRKRARHKMLKNLTSDPRSGFKMRRK